MMGGEGTLIERLLEMKGTRGATALTGAGVSTESGIPDFRSADGIWRNNPVELGSVLFFESCPAQFYGFWVPLFAEIAECEPNDCHRFLAELEGAQILDSVITQNIDDLHQKGGSQRVHEIHGNYRRMFCIRCRARADFDSVAEQVGAGALPTCAACGGRVRPDIVLFGEMLPESAFGAAQRAARSCRLLIALGSSLSVSPACDLVPLAASRGAEIAIVNREPTPFDHLARWKIDCELGEFGRTGLEALAAAGPAGSS